MIVPSLTRLLLAVLVAIATLFVVFAFLPAPAGSGAAAHPEYPAMLVGGDGDQGRVALALGWLLGALEIALFSLLVLIGGGRRALDRGLLQPVVRGSIVYLFVWTFMVAGYRAWLAGQSGASLLGLPLPTVMLIFVLWPLPVFYVVLYVCYFRHFVYDDADAARLREIIRARESA
jgi:hypothetical protein